MKLLLLLYILVLLYKDVAYSYPLPVSGVETSTPCDEECQKYLVQYGYIDSGHHRVKDSRYEGTSGPEIGSLLMSTDDILEGIRNLQKDGGIKESGIMDSETLNLMQVPRCGNFNRQKRFVILEGWNTTKNKINETLVTWYFDTSNFKQINTKLDLDTIKTVFRTAMSKWSKTSLIELKEVDDERRANITIQFLDGDHGDGYKFDGPGNILAHAFYPSQGRRGGDVHFDLGEEWTLWDEQHVGTSLFNVAIHELGHSLGIGHSSQNNSVMYAWYTPKNIELSEDDSHAINQLYGVRPEYKFGPRGPGPRTTPSPSTPSTLRPSGYTTQKYNMSDFKKLFIQNSKVFIYPRVATLSI